uniref:Voltagegated Ion Channel (VIC) Superfamily putative n=1 Tax=Albugo laibachii Nc14 TaxID=890382 RepID=F0WJ10_9STRA|nr:Voltagegated Ion Channel (VIC) Superfamily putative [Albugo laibachii Nc14]|eukprot:CCA21256.1 Voltagegated Ion Channel (VIC) Superfamily putative [Albugo laibachii Nc14]
MPSRSKIYVHNCQEDHSEDEKAEISVLKPPSSKSAAMSLLKSFLKRLYRKVPRIGVTAHSISVVLACLYLIISIPLRFGLFFDPYASSEQEWNSALSLWTALDLCVDMVGLSEFLRYRVEWKHIFQEKMQGSFMKRLIPFLDIGLEYGALLPVELIALAYKRYNLLHILRLTKLCRLRRIPLKLLIADSIPMARRLRTGVSTLIVAIGCGIVLAHWFACIYVLIGNIECGVAMELCKDKQYESSWMVRDRLIGNDLGRKYSRAIYWASRSMVLLGYDDVTPVTAFETIYVVLVQIIGAIFSTKVLATFSFIIRNRTAQHAVFLTHMDNTKAYMKSRNIPRPLQRKIMSYLNYVWETHHGLEPDRQLTLLPVHLQFRVAHSLKANRLRELCFLAKESANFINILVLSLILCVYSPNDCIMEPKMSTKMFFVVRGKILLTALDGRVHRTCQRGDHFAAICLFDPERCDDQAIAKTFSEVYALSKTLFEEATRQFYGSKHAQVKENMATKLERYQIQLQKTSKLLGLPRARTTSSNFTVSGAEWRLPDSQFRARWDVARLLGLLYVAFEVPFFASFMAGHRAKTIFNQVPSRISFVFTFGVELFFLLDLALRSRWFAYWNPQLLLHVIDPHLIFKLYRSAGFWIDFTASIPIALLLDCADIKMIPWIRLLRLARLRHLRESIRHSSQNLVLSFNMTMILSLLLYVTLLLHYVGCLWYVISWLGASHFDAHQSIDHDGLTRSHCLFLAFMHQNCSWIRYDCYGHIGTVFPVQMLETDHGQRYSISFAYARSIYWAVVALTGVGYGDIVAFTTVESYFAALWIFVGGIINFGVVGAMSATISGLLASHHHHVKKLNAAELAMETHRVSNKLRIDIHQYYEHHYHTRKKAYESQLLSHLPEQLCHQISSLLHSEASAKLDLFQHASQDFRDQLTGHFRHRTYQSGETLCFEGNVCREFFVIIQGRVNGSFQSQSAPICALTDGHCYGESGFLLRKLQPVTLVAVSRVEASVVSREHFEPFQRKFPQESKRIKLIAQEVWRQESERYLKIGQNLKTKQKLRSHALLTSCLYPQPDANRRQNLHTSIRTASARSQRSSRHASETAWTRSLLPSLHEPDDPELVCIRRMNRWKLILTSLIFYNAYIIIFRIGFHSQLSKMPSAMESIIWGSDAVSDVMYIADIWLSLFYFDCASSRGLWNLFRWEEINSKYRHSRRFRLHVIASLPLDYLSRKNQLVIGLARLFKLLRCIQLPSLLEDTILHIQQLASKDVSSYLDPFKLALVLFLVAHYAACIFFWISENECKHHKGHCWIEHDHIVHEYHGSLASLYIRSFYWALTTLTLVGSREIVPRDLAGTLWAGFTCLGCTFLMSHIVGELSELILQVDRDAKEYQRHIGDLEHLASKYDFPSSLREQMIACLMLRHQHKSGRQLATTFHDLPVNLRLDLMLQVYGSLLHALPISPFLSLSQINNLALHLQSELFVPGDAMLMENTLGNRLCILKDGFAGVFWHAPVLMNVGILAPGCLFGEIGFFLPSQRRIAGVQATTYSEVLFITRDAWEELWIGLGSIERYATQSILKWVRARMEYYQNSNIALSIKLERVKHDGSSTSEKSKPRARRRTSLLERVSIQAHPTLLMEQTKHLLTKVNQVSRQLEAIQPKKIGTTQFRSSRSNVSAKSTFSEECVMHIMPVRRSLRHLLTPKHLKEMERECWKRMKLLAALGHSMDEKITKLAEKEPTEGNWKEPLRCKRSQLRRVGSLPGNWPVVFALTRQRDEDFREKQMIRTSGKEVAPVIDFHTFQNCHQQPLMYGTWHAVYEVYRKGSWKKPFHSSKSQRTNESTQTDDFISFLRRISRAWQFGRLGIACFYALIVPFRAGFASSISEGIDSGNLIAWQVIENVVDALCLMDFVLQFRTRNLCESLAILPLDLFALLRPREHFSANWYSLSYLRLNKLLHLLRLENVAEKCFQIAIFELQWAEDKLKIVWSLIKYLLMGHWIACIWFLSSEHALRIYGHSWLSYSGMLVPHEIDAGNSFLGSFALSRVSISLQYFRSLHFAIGSITTLFYGDVVSMNLLELLVEIIVILWSIYVFGALIGAHGEQLVMNASHKANLEQKSVDLEHYMNKHELSKELQEQARHHLGFCGHPGQEYHENIDMLSRHLRELVLHEMMRVFVAGVAVFQSFDICFVRALLPRLTAVNCIDEERILMTGDMDRAMYFVQKGRILIENDCQCEMVCSAGGYFGELMLLYGIPSMETCTAATLTELYRLDHASLERLLHEFPECRSILRRNWTIGSLGLLSFQEDVTRSANVPEGLSSNVVSTFVYRSSLELLGSLQSNVEGAEARNILFSSRKAAEKSTRSLME